MTRLPTSTVAAASTAGLVALAAVYTDGAAGLGWLAAGVAVAAIWARRTSVFPGDEWDARDHDVWYPPRPRAGGCERRWSDGDDDREWTADGLAAIRDDLTNTTNGDET